MKKFGKVAVLAGGFSAERTVSLNSGTAVASALKSQGINAVLIDPAETNLLQLKTQGFEAAFNLLHGTYGEDGTVQALLNTIGIPYTGSGLAATALGMDKYRSKLVWHALGLPVPDFAVLRPDSDFSAIETALGLPLFVKPAAEGSSVGVVKVKTAGQLPEVYARLQHLHGEILAERCIDGAEYTCALLKRRTLPPIRIIPATEFYDYEAKYLRDDTVYLCPSGLSPKQEEEIGNLALVAADAIGLRSWGRVDFLQDRQGKFYLLEINTVPGMTDHSLVPKAAANAGLTFTDLCMEILNDAAIG